MKFLMASNNDALVLFFFFSSSNNLNNLETTFSDGSLDCSDIILIVFIIDKYKYNEKIPTVDGNVELMSERKRRPEWSLPL
jgi:hypothetical protein